MGTQALALAENMKLVAGKLEKYQYRLSSDPVLAKKIAGAALSTFTNPKNRLQDCTWKSIISSVIQAAQIDLFPDNFLGQCYLVPFKNHGIAEATLMIGYKGYIYLALKSPECKAIGGKLVYSNEPFEIQQGTKPYIRHVPLPPSERGDKVIGAYAFCNIEGLEEARFEWMWLEEIEACRQRSKAKDSGPWITDTEQMQIKTPIRRLGKYLPLNVQVARAVAIDEQVEMPGAARAEMFFEDPDDPDVAGEQEASPETLSDKTKERVKEGAGKYPLG